MKYLLLIAVVCMASCKAQKEGQGSDQDSDIVLIAEDAYSGIATYESAIITDAKALSKFYSRINRTRKPGLPVPQVDFSSEMVVVVCMGEQKGAKTPVLNRYNESENQLSLTLKPSMDSSQDGLEVISSPFYVYKMPSTPKKVEIQKKGW